MTTAFDFDAAVVGAGAVGLSCGYALAKGGDSVLVLEREHLIGQGVSSRNSEVIHGGLYYPTGSLKAELCVAGRRLMYPFLEAHGVAYDKCGKIVVATSEAEIARVEGVAKQPETGIFDTHGFMLALQGEIEARGGTVAVDAPFEGAEPLPGGGFTLRIGGTEPTTLTVRRLVIAASLGAQAAAAKIEGYPADQIPKLHYGKGVYFVLNGKAPFQRLVYPPPITGALGVHYKRDLGGRAHFGPDLEFVDTLNYDVDPTRAAGFYDYVRHFWPALPDGALVPDYAGIRPKLHGPGEPQPDFRIDGPERHGLPGLISLFGIESPGLTSSLGIGEKVAKLLQG